MIRFEVAPEPLRELASFVERQVRNAREYAGVERRAEERLMIVVPVWAQPVDEQFHPIGECFTLVTRDISAKGFGLVHSEPIEHPLLALQMHLADEEVNVVVKVIWQKAFGPFEYIGSQFVAELPEFPATVAAEGPVCVDHATETAQA